MFGSLSFEKSSGKSCVVYKKGVSAALAGAGGEASVVEAAAGWSEDSEVIGKMREELGAPDTLGVIETGVRNDPLLVFKLPGRNIVIETETVSESYCLAWHDSWSTGYLWVGAAS